METAAAQSSSNRSAAIASGLLNNYNEVTPYGTKKFTNNGYYTGRDELGKKFRIPLRTSTVTLSPAEQAKPDASNKMQLGMLGVGNDQIGRLADTLGKPLNFNGAVDRVTSLGRGPSLVAPTSRTPLASTYAGGGTVSNFASPVRGMSGTTPDYMESYAPKDGFSVDRARVSAGIMSRANPQLEQQRRGLESRLLAQGLQRGTPAFERAMQEQGQNYNDALIQADLAGGQEQSRLLGEARAAGGFTNGALAQGFQDRFNANQLDFGQGLAGWNANREAQGQREDQNAARAAFRNAASLSETQRDLMLTQAENAARQQMYQNRAGAAGFTNQQREAQIQEAAMLRNQPINEIGALLGSGQINNPQFSAPYRQGIDPSPVGDYVYQSYNAKANAAAQQNQGMFGLASSLMALPFAFSDRRLKTDVRRIGTTPGGLPWYSFRYVWGGPVVLGVMADDAARLFPEAVVEVGGFLAVEYSRIA